MQHYTSPLAVSAVKRMLRKVGKRRLDYAVPCHVGAQREAYETIGGQTMRDEQGANMQLPQGEYKE